jgi:hypothetical protein
MAALKTLRQILIGSVILAINVVLFGLITVALNFFNDFSIIFASIALLILSTIDILVGKSFIKTVIKDQMK